MRNVYTLCAILLTSLFSAQLSAQLVDVQLEVFAEHDGDYADGVNLDGFTTYRLYAVLTNEDDFVSSVFGLEDAPLNITTTTSFWQSDFGANTGSAVSAAILGAFPSAAYDSWVTIGRSNSSDPGSEVQALQSAGEPWVDNFAAGNSIIIDGVVGGAWFTLFGAEAVNALPDEDGRVLIGQFTTDGEISGSVNVQVFVNNTQANAQNFNGVEINVLGGGTPGCTDANACNYNMDATDDDGSCEYLSCCEAAAGEIATDVVTCVEEGGNFSATEVMAPTVPEGYVVAYVLTQGAELVIIDLNAAASFSGLTAGSYTIHTFVYPEGLDLSIVEFGVTTGFDVNGLLAQGGGTLCAALDVTGASATITVCEPVFGCTDELACNYDPDADTNDESCEYASCCEAVSGTLTITSVTCVDEGGNVTAEINVAPFIPEGYSVGYALTEGVDLIVMQLSDTPNFNDLPLGSYFIHMFVYPTGFDFSFIILGETSGFDIVPDLVQGGGTICAALDVDGAAFEIEECEVVDVPGCTDDSACNFNGDANVDDGSCEYPGDACDDGNPDTINDALNENCECVGEEVVEVPGCTDATACNYSADANTDDGSCEFPGDPCDDGNPDTIDDTLNENCDCVGEIVEEVLGCTDDTACNFDADANTDDGSCEFPGDDCDDGDPETVNDVLTEDCDCEGTVNIDEHFMASVRVFPNPVSNELTIDLGGYFTPVMLTVNDLTGRMVISEQVVGRTTINVDHLAVGMYVLLFESPDGRGELKIMVTR